MRGYGARLLDGVRRGNSLPEDKQVALMVYREDKEKIKSIAKVYRIPMIRLVHKMIKLFERKMI